MNLIAEEFKTIKVPSRLFLASMLGIEVAIPGLSMQPPAPQRCSGLR